MRQFWIPELQNILILTDVLLDFLILSMEESDCMMMTATEHMFRVFWRGAADCPRGSSEELHQAEGSLSEKC